MLVSSNVLITCLSVCLFFCCCLGQYDGLSKPLPEYHTKISGFDEKV